jgi:hypothetical protein
MNYTMIALAALGHFALTEAVVACPSCKDAALSAGSQPLLLGYSVSILMMIAVPLIVLATLVLHMRSLAVNRDSPA